MIYNPGSVRLSTAGSSPTGSGVAPCEPSGPCDRANWRQPHAHKVGPVRGPARAGHVLSDKNILVGCAVKKIAGLDYYTQIM